MPVAYIELPNSTFLDYESYRGGSARLSGGSAAHNFTINVALVFDRANDPTALLDSNWASRQQQIDAWNDSGALMDDLWRQPGKLQRSARLPWAGVGQPRYPDAQSIQQRLCLIG